MEDILIGSTDRTILVFISDPASTDGSGKTGLVAANLTVSYTRVETDNDVTINDVTSSLNNLASLTAAHNDWGVIEVSSTLAPGLYRLDIADAVFASGAWYAVVYVEITTGAAAATPKAFKLVAYNPLDGVRLGLTSLPNAAADGAGGLPISDAGGLDLDAKVGALTFTVSNKVDANITAIAGSTSAATNQKYAALGIYYGTVTGTSTSTTIVDSGLTQSNDFWNGRVVIFLTGSLTLQATRITDFDASTDTLTVDALTTAPSASDTYIIV